MSSFTERQLNTLRLICDTLAPSLAEENDSHGLYARSASDLNIGETIREAFDTRLEPGQGAQLRLFLNALESPLVNALLSQNGKAFSQMNLPERTNILLTWSESPIPAQRRAFQAVKRLALFLFYSVVDAGKQNPNWAAIGYGNLPQNSADNPTRPIQPLTITEDTILRTDVVIIGSGAGGGVVAGELAGAGKDVIVIEKGGYYADSDFDGYEQSSTEKMFEKSGLLTSEDLSISILAGSVLGGGTTINWAASFHTPDNVLAEWEDDYALPELNSPAYRASLDAVAQRINVNTQESVANAQNGCLERGALALNYHPQPIPRNVKGCEDCGFCNFGCQFGAKQGTLKTYLQDAHDAGARILVGTHVERVLIQEGRAIGVQAITTSSDGKAHRVTVHADKVVVAAGSLQTPALLLRSGLSNAHIGRNLHLHPTSVIFGLHNDLIRPWSGAMMSRVVRDFANLDGQGYGVTLETAPVHPGISAMTLSWQSGYQHKSVMERLDHLANIIIITRDRDGGRVTIGRDGQPRIHYHLSRYDGRHLTKGIVEALRIQHAAGAYEISAPFTLPYVYRRENRDGSLEGYLSAIEGRPLQPNRFALFSAHQMSSCRMAGSPGLGALNPRGESYEVKNLFVADGSALPTASGVNPMLTIMGVAHYIAQGLK